MKISKTKAAFVFLAVILLMVPLSLYSRVSVKLVNDEPLLAVATTGKIYGKVIDLETGVGIPSATLYLNDHEKEVKTDANGNFYFIGIEEDKYKVFARKDGYIKAVLIAKVGASESIEVNFKLKKAIDAPPPPPAVSDGTPPPPPPDKEKIKLKEKEQKQKQLKIQKNEKMLKQKELERQKVEQKRKERKIKKQQYQQQMKNSEPTVIGGLAELSKYVKYPQSAIDKKIEGTVYVKTLISKSGKVKKTTVKKSLTKDCDKSALNAVYSVKFNPAMKDGIPKEVWVTIPVKFSLSD